MRKSLKAILVFIALVFTVTACSNSSEDMNTSKEGIASVSSQGDASDNGTGDKKDEETENTKDKTSEENESKDTEDKKIKESEKKDNEGEEIEKEKLGKVLIAYYSFSGKTRVVANAIKEITGGDIFEIIPEENYNRSDLEEYAKKQIKDGFKPKLKETVSDFESYDVVIVGSPVWWFSVSPPVASFLSEYDFKDKKIIPFCTYTGAIGDFFDTFKKACSSGDILNGRDFINSKLDNAEELKAKIEEWLSEIM